MAPKNNEKRLNTMKKVKNAMGALLIRSKTLLKSRKAEGFIDSAVKILIAVVIGALLLGGLYTLFGDSILPTLTTKIQGLFNYAG
jgi:hypothetical protein